MISKSENKFLIGIVDTGTSNIMSVIHACNYFSINYKVIKNYENHNNISGIIVPGVGSYKAVMYNLKKNELDNFIKEFVASNKPSLFICIGMQILFEKSEEFGKTSGLGILSGYIKKIPSKYNKYERNVPMIGWNNLDIKKVSEIFLNINAKTNFYFTHSYYADVYDSNIIHSTVNYNQFLYCSSIEFKNIFATQFHPEKSGIEGMKVYKNFYNKLNS